MDSLVKSNTQAEKPENNMIQAEGTKIDMEAFKVDKTEKQTENPKQSNNNW